MRAVLVVNPRATATTAGGREVLAHALASEVKLDIVETDYRGHAEAIAQAAAADGVDYVVAHGGDGTVNEVVNGLLGNRRAHTGTPVLGVVPGGSANVFARAIGLPRDPIEATYRLLHAIDQRHARRIGLGVADGRWFTFNSGLGWDADVVAGVEQRRGKRTSPWLYTRTALSCYLRPPLGRARLTVEVPGVEATQVRTAFVSNTDPWSYLGNRPIHLNPGCSFDSGLGLFGLTSLAAPSVLLHARRALSNRGTRDGRRVVRHDDVGTARITSDEPVNFQVDGDLVGQRSSAEFHNVPSALTVAV